MSGTKDKSSVSPEEQPFDEKKEIKDKFEDKTFFEKLCAIKSNITVEPILAGLIIPSTLSRLAVQNLNLDKSCRVKLNFGEEICDALLQRNGNLTYYEGEVQKVISSIEAWKSIIQTAIPTLLVIFMGAWSDRTVSVEVTMFLEALFPAVTGGWVMVYLGVFSYISDITSEESRTFRVGLANLCMTAGIPIGTALSGILLKLLGYYGIFAITASIYVITLSYGLFYLKKNSKPSSGENEETKPVTISELATLIKETILVAFKKRDGKTRKKIIITLLTVAIVYGPNHGERIITYMFVRYRLKWDAVKYSLYSTYSIITHSLGALFSITVFSKRWGFHDSLLCLISIASKLAGSVCIAFVRTDFEMFMVPLVEILNALTFTSLRSMISKLVLSEEVGKTNSLFSLVETLAALVFDPTYSTLYSKTIPIFAGTVYIFSAVMTLPPISMLIWLFIQHRRDRRLKRIQATSCDIMQITNKKIKTVSELQDRLTSCQQELEELKERYRELDEECETCAEYLRERDDQCRKLKKEKASLENIIKELNEKLQRGHDTSRSDAKVSYEHAAVNTDEGTYISSNPY
ncbi:Solute carrier family 46 member 3 [Papilio machaon]|uniref:Solute carrier family 46 member 3 n=1 Tax=Papilio machaon TaxID=76193 RepID=A0A194REL6_PAPMA|nr:Solute carrier family 46 member 3 [Papilio machaon]